MRFRTQSGAIQHADTPAEQARAAYRGWTVVEDEPAAEAATETEPAPASTEDPEPRKSAKSAKK